MKDIFPAKQWFCSAFSRKFVFLLFAYKIRSINTKTGTVGTPWKFTDSKDI